MATCNLRQEKLQGDATPPVGGSRRKPPRFATPWRLRQPPKTELERRLLTLFQLHPFLLEKFYRGRAAPSDVAVYVANMDEGTQNQLLARMERALEVPREELGPFMVAAD